jgi:hypothetical protein
MDIHTPKPWRGSREFLKEIGTIVIGVLIALGAEQVAVSLRDRHAADEARGAVYTEIRLNLSYMQGRMATQACVERRLDEIGALLVKAGEGPLAPRPSWIGQPSSWLIAAQRWQAATGSGRVSLFDGAEQGRLAGVYSPLSRFAEAQESEQAAWAQLRGLETWNGPLGAAGRIHFLSALQQARYELWNTRVAMEMAFRRARALGITHDMPNATEQGYELPHAVCLPIDTPRDKAVAQLALGSPPWGQPR